MKITVVINRELPVGLIANAAAVLGASLGKSFPDIVGEDIVDSDGRVHPGITTKTIPVLGATREQVKGIHDKLCAGDYSDIVAFDFSEVAQKCLDYANYTEIMSGLGRSELYYLGVCLYGPSKKVNSLTGNLGLLR